MNPIEGMERDVVRNGDDGGSGVDYGEDGLSDDVI